MATATIHLSAKIDQELRNQIQELAKIEDRTMSHMVRRLLREGVNTFKEGVNTPHKESRPEMSAKELIEAAQARHAAGRCPTDTIMKAVK